MGKLATTLQRYVPAARWLPHYRRADLRGDLGAGLTTAVMLVPQAMAYAMLAELPPIVGLYASVVPLVLYGLFGSSRELAVGPVAMVSLLVASGVGAVAEPGTETFIAYAVVLAMLVGVMQLGMGLLRAGFVVNFLSHPVISGFTSAAALIIGFSQLKHLLGVNISSTHHVHEVLIQAVSKLGEVSVATTVLGVTSIAALLVLKRISPTFPRALAVVVVGTLAVVLLGLEGVSTVGEVPAGLPAPAFPALSGDAVVALLPTALVIALVGFMESISVAKAFAARRGYPIDANQELIGLGLANIGAGFFRGYPVTGGFSRTAVNAQAGARTGMASLVTAGIIALSLLFLTPLFFYLPKAVLAAIIMTAVFGLIDVAEVKHLWHVKRGDLVLLVITFFATLSLGIELGIGIGVGASLLWFIIRTTRPHYAVLGRLPGTTDFRNVKNHPEVECTPGVIILRVDAQFYFGNVSFLKETLACVEAAQKVPVHTVIIDACSMNQLDSSAATALVEIAKAYAARGVSLHFATVKRPVMIVMERSHLAELLGPGAFHLNVHEALASSQAARASRGEASGVATAQAEAQARVDAASGITELGCASGAAVTV